MKLVTPDMLAADIGDLTPAKGSKDGKADDVL